MEKRCLNTGFSLCRFFRGRRISAKVKDWETVQKGLTRKRRAISRISPCLSRRTFLAALSASLLRAGNTFPRTATSSGPSVWDSGDISTMWLLPTSSMSSPGHRLHRHPPDETIPVSETLRHHPRGHSAGNFQMSASTSRPSRSTAVPRCSPAGSLSRRWP